MLFTLLAAPAVHWSGLIEGKSNAAERRFKPGADGDLRADFAITRRHYLKNGKILSK
jgi:hypothetical protein